MSNPELTHEASPLERKARTLVRATASHPGPRPSATRRMARGLGWFSIGLGLVELLAARALAPRLGLRGSEPLLQVFGLREIVNGIGLLGSPDARTSSGWAWARVAGDALDASTLAAAASRGGRAGAKAAAALGAVAGVAALDVTCAQALVQEARAEASTTDYSDRTGIPAPPEQMRGAALSTFSQPEDMRVSPVVSHLLH